MLLVPGQLYETECSVCVCLGGGELLCQGDPDCGGACIDAAGNLYQEGDAWELPGGCGWCECMNGGVTCYEDSACGQGCHVGGQWYPYGEMFPAPDGCNTCVCGADGMAACTQMGCPDGCYYEGDYFAPGEEFPTPDGCGWCWCGPDGVLECKTDSSCGGSCTWNGQTWASGQTFPAGDGCNTCTCEDGQVYCTEMGCPGVCYANGGIYQVGQVFESPDGCGACLCLPGGEVVCEQSSDCAPQCEPGADHHKQYVATDVETCWVIDYMCPANTEYFSDDCGCGCQMADFCPEFINCMPPSMCNVEGIMELCPYTEIAY